MTEIIATDIDDNKLARAKQNGATNVINVRDEDIVEAIGAITDNYGVNTMIDAAGLSSTITNASSLVQKSGAVLIFGVPHEDSIAEVIPYEIYKHELKIIGTYTNPYSNSEAMELLKVLNLSDLITDPISLDQIVDDGFERIGKEGVLKVQVQFD